MKNEIKTRRLPESNYKAVWCGGKTLRLALDRSKDISELRYPEFYDIDIFETMNGLCKANCPYCFIDGEQVNTVDGLKVIEEIKLDDLVYSFDEEEHSVIIKPVSQLFTRKYIGEIIIIELENGEFIKCTDNHRFYTINRGWVEAKDLLGSDELFDI